MFPGMPLGAMHMGPNGPGINMTGPAPAANGPTGANPPTAGGTSAGNGGSGAAGAAAGQGQGAGWGQGMGFNQAFGQMLQSALSGAGGQPNRPGPGWLLSHCTLQAHV